MKNFFERLEFFVSVSLLGFMWLVCTAFLTLMYTIVMGLACCFLSVVWFASITNGGKIDVPGAEYFYFGIPAVLFVGVYLAIVCMCIKGLMDEGKGIPFNPEQGFWRWSLGLSR